VKFEAEVYVLSKEEGGRHTPFFSGYRPQFYFRTTDVTGTTKLLGGAEMCMPGDNVRIEVELGKPIALEDGVPIRHPRGWQDGGFRRRDQDPPVIFPPKTNGCLPDPPGRQLSFPPRCLVREYVWLECTESGARNYRVIKETARYRAS
jgi:hypothetical protein